MTLQVYTLALGNFRDDTSGNNYAANTPVYILNSGGTLADIFRDQAGAQPIAQDGLNNISDAYGEFTFYVNSGQYISRVAGRDRLINVVGSDYFDSRVDDAVEQITQQTLASRGFRVVGTFADGFTYELFNDVGIDASGDSWIYVGAGAPNKAVTAGTVPSVGAGYQQVTFNSARGVQSSTGNVQDFIDSFELKVFQSPTTSSTTLIESYTKQPNQVFEVRKTSDDTLATIYSDEAGTTEIVQNGTNNISGSDGVVEFYITAGDYYIEVGSTISNFAAENLNLSRKTNVTVVNSGAFKVGSLLKLSDRASAIFEVLSGGTPNGFDVIDAGGGNVAITNIQDVEIKSLTSSSDLLEVFTYLSTKSENISLTMSAGEYSLSASVELPSNITLFFKQGALINVAIGETLTITGEVIAPNTEIFGGDGAVNLDNSSNGYNLAWFREGSGYINQRFAFASRGMKSYRFKKVIIPKPRQGDNGVFNSNGRLFRYFNAPITIDDPQNNMDIYIECEFYAKGNCESLLKFTGAAKPENINVYGSFLAGVAPDVVVGTGIDIQAMGRLSFWGNVILNGFQTSVKIGSEDMVQSVGAINIPRLQCAFFYENAVLIRGNTTANNTQGVRIGNVTCTAAQKKGLSAIKMSGILRNITIDNVVSATDVPKNGYAAEDAENVVEINADTAGLIATHIHVGSIYQASANNGLLIKSDEALTGLIANVKVERIYGKLNGSAAKIDYCSTVNIEEVENSSEVTIGSNAIFTNISSGAGIGSIDDNGSNTIINGFGNQTRGGGAPPSPTTPWPIGCKIRETSDDKVYLRVAKDNLASDFIALN